MKFSKHSILQNFFKASMVFTLSMFLFNCSEPDDSDDPTGNPNASSINEYIFGLNYDPNELLNVRNTGGEPSNREETGTNEGYTDPVNGTTSFCSTTSFSLDSNFSDVAILRPNVDAIYPGALVAGNDRMLDGNPDPLSIEKGDYIIRVNLPGIGQNGVLNINNPSKSVVDTKIDNALQWWYNNANENVNPSNSIFSSANLYSSTQLSMDIGLNLAWADNNVAAQLQFTNNTERRVATMSFKQVFFTVTLDSPSSPAAMLGNTLTVDDVMTRITDEQPAAYVSSVSYGRIVLLRMETTYSEETADVDLSAALDYSVDVNATFNSDYEAVLSTSTFKLLTIGGNAEIAVSPINNADIDSGPGGVRDIITGSNALVSANNPGVPIAYTMRYLKDNSIAKMGYNTTYAVEQCDPNAPYVHEEVTVKNDSYHDTRFYFRYRPQETNYFYNGPSYELNQGSQTSRRPPHGAYDVKIIFESQIGFGDFEQIDSEDLGYIESDLCYEFTGGDWNDHGTVNDDCN